MSQVKELEPKKKPAGFRLVGLPPKEAIFRTKKFIRPVRGGAPELRSLARSMWPPSGTQQIPISDKPTKPIEWECLRFTPLQNFFTVGREVVLLLNYHLPQDLKNYFQAELKVCVDGGADRLHAKDNTLIPDYLVGDLDSLSPEGKTFYSSKNSKIVYSPRQDTTDLQKSLEIIFELEEKQGWSFDTLILLGGLGGSFGHSFANLNAAVSHPNRRMILIGPESLGLIAWPGKTIIRRETQLLKSCDLIPLGGPCRVTTEGFKWNLNDQVLAFGALVSTSNEMETDCVIETDSPLLWVLDFAKDIDISE